MNIDITPLIEAAFAESKGRSYANAVDELINWVEQQRYRPLRRGEPEGSIPVNVLLDKLYSMRMDGYREEPYYYR